MRAEDSYHRRIPFRKRHRNAAFYQKDRGRSQKILATLHRAAELFERALTPEHAGWIALVTLTAGEGFGFNRAFVLRRTDGSLRGWLGIGPRTGEEAARLWQQLQALDVKPLASLGSFQPELVQQEKTKWEETLQALTTPLQQACAGWRRAFVARRDFHDPCVRRWIDTLQSPLLVVLPMARQGTFWGVVLADNFVTRSPISTALLEGAEALCHNLQGVLERTELWARFQEEQEARRKAEQAVLLVEAARALAHDIKNPLTAAAGLLQHLLQNPPHAAEEWGTWARKIAEGLGRVERQVNQLVQELASRGHGMELKPTEVVALVQRLVGSWQPLAESRNITLRLIAPQGPVYASADPAYLDRCVENLLSNAVKAVGLGGEVQVAVAEEMEWVRVSVADNGQPLPQTLRSDPFGVHGAQPGGAGEGLASVRRLSEAMGGKVEYDETEPGWVRFSLLLRRWA